MTHDPFDDTHDQAGELARHRDGVLDLVATVVLRCGGAPHHTIVAVMFAGDEDLADHHTLEVMDVGQLEEDGDPAQVVEVAARFLPQLRQAVAASRAERMALVTFDVPEPAAKILTGHASIGLQLPAQRVAVADAGWVDLDNPEVFGDLDEVVHSRAATSAVLAGLPFPAREFER
ncbi:hypothetical protein [Pseudactinotalea terrae]|uniref:hypothetical protein n=1 Tax=Pseudactinotalea terrae TaxID=1743262 RepID=UPI0012E1A6F8|nr:hypothetical protein [Pseudactinotalea terrae]